MRTRGAPLGAPLMFWASVLAAQPPPGYTAAMLQGASFDERVRATIRTQTGGASRTEVVGREGRWQMEATDEGGQIRVVAWYDSLHMWRDAREGRLRPDTDGVIGGRYRGSVSRSGNVTLDIQPFMPDEVAEVSDLSQALVTFFPPVPPIPLSVNASWDDGAGLRISRRADSTAAGTILQRFRWTRASVDTVSHLENDSLAYEVRSTLREDGTLAWHPLHGPVAWWRDAVTEVEIPADGAVRQPARSRVEERMLGWRRRAP